jgi:hypothetical protein
MAATFTSGGFQIGTTWTYSNGQSVGAATSQSQLNLNLATTSGTSANNADLLYVTSGSITASGSLNIDLAGSVLDFYGNTLTFARVKQFVILLQAATGQATSVLVGNGSNAFVNWCGANTHTVRIRAGTAGGGFALGTNDSTGYAVTANTGDILKILNEDATNAAAYQISISGCSA